ncbi:MAG: S8 family serine peptidase [Candidatus Heimdallarchaeota archaeon]|nr:S8 family serine peptidase [Candidatus Heimdallarchaeota archaeon]
MRVLILLLLIPFGLSTSNVHCAGPLGQGGAIDFNEDKLPWNLEMINIADAWKITNGSEEIVVAIIDSGINWNSELPESLRWVNEAEANGTAGVDDDDNGYIDDIYGYDFDDRDTTPDSEASGGSIHWHGTFIAGLIAGLHNNVGVEGIAPNVKIMDLRVLDQDNYFWNFDSIDDAFNYAIDKNASVINFSIYFAAETPSYLRSTFQKTVSSGIPIAGITGNDYNNEVSYPGKEATIIATGALNKQGQVAAFSNTGKEIELVAPGESVGSISTGGSSLTGSGTSFAAPHVAGLLALMRSIRYDLSVTYLREILRSTATDLMNKGFDRSTGYGLINAAQAINGTYNFESFDFDEDGLNTSYELSLGLNPFHKDSDSDKLPDDVELQLGMDPSDPTDGEADNDDDGLTNGEEYVLGTNMDNNDSDAGGAPDKFELDWGFDPLNITDDSLDGDNDSLSNAMEWKYGTDPWNSDTDNDKLPDGFEIVIGSDPLVADADLDADGDGFSNLDEYLGNTTTAIIEETPFPYLYPIIAIIIVSHQRRIFHKQIPK